MVIDKPADWTSHDVVARIRRLTGERRVGHAGTLDPLATGVLPVALGQGTRVLQYVADSGKAYRATIHFGVTTDTYDSAGRVTATAPTDGLTCEGIEEALSRFRGRIEQRPPAFSALKRAGRPLYSYARSGIELQIEARPVHVSALELRRCDLPDVEVEIECGSGFYVRSLAHDLGQRLGCGAHLTALVRTRVGRFTLDNAIGPDELAAAIASDQLNHHLWALDTPLQHWPAVVLAEPHSLDVVNGKMLRLAARDHSHRLCRAYTASGEFLAILEILATGELRPAKVFPAGRRGPNLAHPINPKELST